jgi:hypothetical protein
VASNLNVRGLLSADGVQLNQTQLTETVLLGLATLVKAQTESLQQISTVFTVQTNCITLQNLAVNLSAELAAQTVMVRSAMDLLVSVAQNVSTQVSNQLSTNALLSANQVAANANATDLLMDVLAEQSANQAATNHHITLLLAAALTPPTCRAPGGDKLQFDGAWICVCVSGWSGRNCTVPPSPPPPSPPLTPPSPLPPSPPPPGPPGALYATTPIKLTSCGNTGRNAPTLAACQQFYSSPPQSYTWPYLPEYYSFGYPPTATTLAAVWQRIVLPQAGIYNITVAGASSTAVMAELIEIVCEEQSCRSQPSSFLTRPHCM